MNQALSSKEASYSHALTASQRKSARRLGGGPIVPRAPVHCASVSLFPCCSLLATSAEERVNQRNPQIMVQFCF